MKVICMLLFVAVANAAPLADNKCPNIQLQESVDFSMIQGVWDQRYFSPDGLFEEMSCFSLNYSNVNSEMKTLNMDYTYIINMAEVVRKSELGDSDFHVSSMEVTWGDKDELQIAKAAVEEESSGVEPEVEASGVGSDDIPKKVLYPHMLLDVDMIATDYNNYLLIANCDPETGNFAIEIYSKPEVGQFTNEQKRELNRHLERLDSHVQLMERIAWRKCDRAITIVKELDDME